MVVPYSLWADPIGSIATRHRYPFWSIRLPTSPVRCNENIRQRGTWRKIALKPRSNIKPSYTLPKAFLKTNLEFSLRSALAPNEAQKAVWSDALSAVSRRKMPAVKGGVQQPLCLLRKPYPGNQFSKEACVRLLVVSNRLPITVSETPDGFSLQSSMGGLVSGLSAYLDSLRGSSLEEAEYVWVGWPGLTVDGSRQEKLAQAIGPHRAYPVFLAEHEMDQFYHGFCNKIVWPLFHYFPTYAQYRGEYWDRYRAVNQIFADTVLRVLRPGDVLWIHDYHLMLLPGLLRQARPDLRIGFFLHIPFPSYEILRLMPRPWRCALLEGLLGADLIGFHTEDYRDYFLRSVTQDLGIPEERGDLTVEGRPVRAAAFPMGIDFQKYSLAASAPAVQQRRTGLSEAWGGQKSILSVDRLDYSKGIAHRLQAFELFLEQNPKWQGKVSLLLVVVPSRIGVEHYQRMKREIDELVGAINGRFGDLHWTPIVYQYRYLPFQELVALYAACDVALITPLRDGMNLVAKEYLAARTDGRGVLILSEMAGAAQELREALLINPNDRGEIAGALAEAITMPEQEQVRRNEPMRARLAQNDVLRWARSFLESLDNAGAIESSMWPALFPDSSLLPQLAQDFERARKRLLLLDYDGTLVPYVSFPEKARPPANLLQILASLAAQDHTEVVVISGRDRQTLERWFASVPALTLVAEHGLWSRERGRGWSGGPGMPHPSRAQLRAVMERYADQVPGAFIEGKEASLAWHYRAAAPERALGCARELAAELAGLHLPGIRIVQGNRVVEARTGSADKGTAARQLVSRFEADLVVGFGDDETDEDLFRALGPEAYTFKVGSGPSVARFRVSGSARVLQILVLLHGLPHTPWATSARAERTWPPNSSTFSTSRSDLLRPGALFAPETERRIPAPPVLPG